LKTWLEQRPQQSRHTTQQKNSTTLHHHHHRSTPKMTTHLVLGARGGCGAHLVRALLARPSTEIANIQAVVRTPASVTEPWITDARVEVLAGDVTTPESLDFQQVDTVYFVCAGRGYELCQAVDRDGVHTVATLCKAHNVRRMVLVSSGLVDPLLNRWNVVRGLLNTINTGLFHYKGMMDFKFEGEELLRASGQEYTILRPGRLGDAARDVTKAVPCCGQTNAGFLGGSIITREALAYLCVDAAMSEDAANVTCEVGTQPPKEVESKTDGAAAIATGVDQLFHGLVSDDVRTTMESTTCG
jgi:uncharacterized protein YbjT (DUF2867 family)